MSFAPEHHVGLPEHSISACALLSHQGSLFLAWTDRDGMRNVAVAPPGGQFGDRRTVGSQPGGEKGRELASADPLAPALAATAGHGVQVAWTARGGRINVLTLGGGGDQLSVLETKTLNGPALAVEEPELYVAWTGTDRRINVARSAGGLFGEPWVVSATTSRRPALVVTNGVVHLAWLGSDGRINVLSTRGVDAPHGWVLDATSSRAPALVPWGDVLLLVWTDPDGRVQVAPVHGDALGDPFVVPGATTPRAPAAVVHDGRLVVGWTDHDDQVNVARLAPAAAT